MAYNKFITQDGVVVLDLTEDTITAETLEKGITAHDKYGALIVGTMESGEVLEEYDGAVIITEIVPENLIAFTIDGKEYQAEDGMTWDEWVESSYNTDGFVLAGTYVLFGSNSEWWVSTKGTSSSMVDYHETITSGFAYVHYSSHSGGA